MLLAPSTRLGPYEVVAPLGSGGMGEVYRARDTRLQRTVAIKILPPQISNQPEVKARFEREAQALASLSHPHICSVFDVGRHNEIDFLVMEFLEGQTLAERLERGALPLDQALKIAGQMADALDKAHRRGITHRDVKPANVMLTAAGAKLLDFGLAKLKAEAGGPSTVSSLPTNVGVTAEGTILGTLQYMAPEQLEGQDADARTDIFAFGALLYEMVTGTKAFEGKSQATLISAIMSGAPRPMREIATIAPPALERIVHRCLEKDPENRWQNARDLVLELASMPRAVEPGAVSTPTRPWVPAAIGMVVLLALLGGVFAFFFGAAFTDERPAWSAAPIRFTISPPEGTTFFNGDYGIPFAVAPDGRQIVFIATSADGTRQLWVRSLDSDTARAVPGTEGASSPFWSPDSEWIGFSTGNSLRKAPAAGGASQVLAPQSNPVRLSATWSPDDVIVFQAAQFGLSRVSAQGGTPSAVTTVDPARPEAYHSSPRFLENGRNFIYSQINPGQIYLGSLDGAPPRLLMDLRNRSTLGYAPGYILYVENTVLYARPFDDDRLELTGEPIRVVDGIPASGPGRAPFSVSSNGVLAYSSNAIGDIAVLQWFERDGRPGTVAAPPANYSGFSIAPDGRRLAFSRWDANGRRDIWLRDVLRGGESRLTSSGDSMMPLWAPQGNRLVFAAGHVRPPDLHIIDLDNGTSDQQLTTSSDVEIPKSWSTDGETIIYDQQGAKGGLDLWVLSLENGKTESLAVNTLFNEGQGRLSPDGRWIAYVSDETGRNEVFVAGFPSGRGKRAVSTGGGMFPQWRADGRELFYVSDVEQLMAVSVTATPSTIDVGAPAELFRIDRAVNLSGRTDAILYDADPTGQRFLIAVRAPASSAPPINVVVNWTAMIQQ